MKWWIDFSLNITKNCKGHTGARISLGKGEVFNISIKQKLNTNILTESELAGADNSFGLVLWQKYLTVSQGYSVTNKEMYKNNQSTMVL